MKIGEIIRKLLDDGASTVEECLDMIYDEKYRVESGIVSEDFFYDALYFLNDIQNNSACITRCDDEGTVENYCFYFNDDGDLVSDHDMRCLNGDGERFMCDEWEGEPCTLQEIVSVWSLGNGDEWHKGWNSVDCDL